jgi:hypothetical protein
MGSAPRWCNIGLGKIRLGERIPDDGECDIEYETGLEARPATEESEPGSAFEARSPTI